MAAVERALVAQGWHNPRWRTSNKEYGKFYQQRPTPPAQQDPMQHLLHRPRPPSIRHVVDYINCSDRCRPPQLRQHPIPDEIFRQDAASLVPSFVQPSAQQGTGLNAHIQHLTLQEERSPMLCGAEQLPCMQGRRADESHEASVLEERPPWKPKPLKPMILFEKYGQALYIKPQMFKHKKNRRHIQ